MLSLSQRLSHLISKNIRVMKAYHVADASGMLKLDAMENPFVWEDELKDKWLATLKKAEINRYPDAQAQGIQKRILKKYSLSDTTNVIFGNGSDELIQLLIMAVASSGRSVMAPSPSFVMYKIISNYLNVPFVDVPLKTDFTLNIEAMLEYIKAFQPALIFLATPNNPTANVYSDDELLLIIEASEGLVVLDEAYTAFTSSDQLHWINKYSHVLVMRTFSKIGLAGLRLGFLFGHKDCLLELDKLRLPYNINILTQHSVEFALDNFPVLETQSELLCEQRGLLMAALNSFTEFSCFPSEANFITVRCLNIDAVDLFEGLKRKKILIKCLHGSHALLDQCLRITVGQTHENKQLLNAIREILS